MKMKKEEGGPRVGLGNRLFVFVPGEEFLLIHLGTCKHDAESNQIKIGPALSQVSSITQKVNKLGKP